MDPTQLAGVPVELPFYVTGTIHLVNLLCLFMTVQFGVRLGRFLRTQNDEFRDAYLILTAPLNDLKNRSKACEEEFQLRTHPDWPLPHLGAVKLLSAYSVAIALCLAYLFIQHPSYFFDRVSYYLGNLFFCVLMALTSHSRLALMLAPISPLARLKTLQVVYGDTRSVFSNFWHFQIPPITLATQSMCELSAKEARAHMESTEAVDNLVDIADKYVSRQGAADPEQQN